MSKNYGRIPAIYTIYLFFLWVIQCRLRYREDIALDDTCWSGRDMKGIGSGKSSYCLKAFLERLRKSIKKLWDQTMSRPRWERNASRIQVQKLFLCLIYFANYAVAKIHERSGLSSICSFFPLIFFRLSFCRLRFLSLLIFFLAIEHSLPSREKGVHFGMKHEKYRSLHNNIEQNVRHKYTRYSGKCCFR